MLDGQIVGRVIQQCRENKKLSQEIVSGLSGIGRTHLSAIERECRKPTMDTFYKIACALDMKPHLLMKLIEEEIEKSER